MRGENRTNKKGSRAGRILKSEAKERQWTKGPLKAAVKERQQSREEHRAVAEQRRAQSSGTAAADERRHSEKMPQCAVLCAA
jgi:hypothetical protein